MPAQMWGMNESFCNIDFITAHKRNAPYTLPCLPHTHTLSLSFLSLETQQCYDLSQASPYKLSLHVIWLNVKGKHDMLPVAYTAFLHFQSQSNPFTTGFLCFFLLSAPQTIPILQCHRNHGRQQQEYPQAPTTKTMKIHSGS